MTMKIPGTAKKNADSDQQFLCCMGRKMHRSKQADRKQTRLQSHENLDQRLAFSAKTSSVAAINQERVLAAY